jgi:dihydrolipoamide dehydrogenase
MMVAAGILGSLSLGKKMGLSFSDVTSDFDLLKKRQDDLIKFMREGVRSTLKKNNVELFQGKGSIAGRGKVGVNGKSLSYKRLVVATGANWLKPGFPGAESEAVINSDGLLVVKDLPQRVLLFDRNSRIIEIAQFLHRFGSQVILATAEKSILSGESKAIRSRLTKALRDQGIDIWTRAEIKSLKKNKDGFQCMVKRKEKEAAVVVDRLISFRRKASLSDMGLGTVGLDEKADFIPVNERMETSVEGIYAIGDVSSPEENHYSHLSSAGGIVASENAMGMDSLFNRRTICRVLFTQPQVACVGLTGREAKQAGYEVVEGAAPLSMNPFGMITSQNEGLVEVVADKKYGEVLGVHFIGEGASEMAGQAVIAIQLEATLEELTRTAFPHPTLSESLAEAARECLGRAIYLP